MKKTLIILISILFYLIAYTNNTKNFPLPSYIDGSSIENSDFYYPVNNVSYVIYNNFDPSTPMGQLDCSLTVSVTIGNSLVGNASASLTITGPCDEMLAQADELFDLVFAKAKAKWEALQ